MCERKNISLILPISGFLIIFFNPLDFLSIIMILFLTFFIILWNFPQIPKSLYARPLYIGDIQNSRFETFYINTMNIILALGCAILFENWILRGLAQKKSIFEITAVIGGNITFSATLQNMLAKILLSICHRFKLQEDARSRRSSMDADDPEGALVTEISLSDDQFSSGLVDSPHSPHRRRQEHPISFLEQGSFSFYMKNPIESSSTRQSPNRQNDDDKSDD